MVKTGSMILAAAAAGFLGLAVLLGSSGRNTEASTNVPPAPTVPKEERILFPVRVHSVADASLVDSGQVGPDGEPLLVSCQHCHATRKPNPDLNRGEDLKEFHLGMTYAHGTLTCLSCHNPRDYTTLRLADEKSLVFSKTMDLCAQCHGPQARDYQSGSHGGMTGHWDLTRGPRERNHCVDCHDPHSPAYVGMQPARGPNDRFLNHTSHSQAAESH